VFQANVSSWLGDGRIEQEPTRPRGRIANKRLRGDAVRLRVLLPMLILAFVVLAVLVGCGKSY
jgi:hypothetical protein